LDRAKEDEMLAKAMQLEKYKKAMYDQMALEHAQDANKQA
jgi:hypothetical protein